MMQRYTVELTMAITANSAREAAELALAELRKPATTTGVFEVTNEAGDVVMTDVGDDEPEYDNCACVGIEHDASCTNKEGA